MLAAPPARRFRPFFGRCQLALSPPITGAQSARAAAAFLGGFLVALVFVLNATAPAGHAYQARAVAQEGKGAGLETLSACAASPPPQGNARARVLKWFATQPRANAPGGAALFALLGRRKD